MVECDKLFKKRRGSKGVSKTQVHIAKLAGILTLMALSSRILGFLRNSFIADFFGQTWRVDSYNASFILPDTLYLILIGGAVSSAFIPVISRYLAEKREDEAWEVASISFNLTLVVFLVLIAFGLAFTPFYVRLLVPGFHNDPRQLALTVFLTRLTLGAVLFSALNGVTFGTQWAHNSFLATSIGPLIYNAAIIVIGVTLHSWFHTQTNQIAAFAGAAVVASFLNFLTQLVGIWRLRPRFRWSLNYRHPGVVQVGRLMLPIALSSSMSQLVLILNQAIIASFLGHGVINALTLASRIMLVPVSAGTQLGIILLPTLTSYIVNNRLTDFRRFFLTSLRTVAFLTVPASVALILLANPAVQVLFQRGHFIAGNTHVTSQALVFYSFGIFAYASLELVNRAFYALGDTWTPFKTSILYLAISLGLNVLLVRAFNYKGLALAYSLGGFLDLGRLLFLLRRHHLGHLGFSVLLGTLLRTALASAGMAGVIILTSHFGHPIGQIPFALLRLVLPSAAGGAAFVLFARLLKAEELSFLWSALTRRRLRVS